MHQKTSSKNYKYINTTEINSGKFVHNSYKHFISPVPSLLLDKSNLLHLPFFSLTLSLSTQSFFFFCFTMVLQ